MMRRPLTLAATVAAGLCLLFGGSAFGAAAATDSVVTTASGEPLSIVIGTTAAPAFGVSYGSDPMGSIPSASALSDGSAVIAANATDGVAAIPLPPSAYPGMVGLATAALSVWRYRRRRR
jgi:hypothetical protein